MTIEAIDISLVNPFLSAAHDVFKQVFSCELTNGHITEKKNPSSDNEVAIIIGISGPKHTGVVVYSMKDDTSKKIVSTLDPDIELSLEDESFSDALGELANMISGNATNILSKQDIDLTITTPSVKIGDAFEMHLLDQTSLSAEMMSPFGNIEINVVVKKF